MTSRAQLSQERSRVRRDELLNAAIELFAQGGSRAITHRAVAAKAGLPPATTTYYFETIDELIQEALRSHIDSWTRELKEVAENRVVASSLSAEDASVLVTDVFARRGPEVANLELSILLAAARVPELRDCATLALHELECLARRILQRLGIGEPGRLAGAVVALIAGTALRRQSNQYAEHTEAQMLTLAIRDLIAAHALGQDGVDRVLDDLRQGHVPRSA